MATEATTLAISPETGTSGASESLPAPRKGFGNLPCPLCGQDAVVALDLDDLDRCTCGECSEAFSLDEVREWIGKWSRVLKTVDALAASLAE